MKLDVALRSFDNAFLLLFKWFKIGYGGVMWGDPKVACQEGDSRMQSIQGPRLFFIAAIMK